MSTSLMMLHICSATVALLSGFMAMAFRKGSSLHGAAGSVFAVSMLSMSGAAAIIATFFRPNNGNVMVGLLAFYMVGTAWMAAKRRERKVGIFDFTALFLALSVATFGATQGVRAAASRTGAIHGYPAGLLFSFASIALLFAVSDIRMLVRGGVDGTKRIVRHLWRMSLALFLATFSLYPGQARLFPQWLRATNLLFVPHVLLVGAILLGLYHVTARRRIPQNKGSAPRPAAPIDVRVAGVVGRAA